jgi:hypothetical protein
MAKAKKLTTTQRIAQLESLFVDLTVTLMNMAQEIKNLKTDKKND